MKIRIFEAFAGYGSQSIALQRLKEDFPGFDFEVAGFSEIDRFAVLAYYAARDARLQGNRIDQLNLEKYEPSPELLAKYPNFGDITKIEWAEVPDFDLFTYSFPCQDISTAGKQRGFDEGSGSRSSLLWECARAIEVKRPKFLLMENVKALTFKKHKDNFKRWRDTLESLGYSNYWAILNAKNFGVPQNRERVFMVSIWGAKLRISTAFHLGLFVALSHNKNNICKIDSPVYHEAIEANGYHYLHYKNFFGYAIPYSDDDKRGGCITVVFVENATSAKDIIKTLEQHPDLQRRFRKRMPQPSEL